MKKMKKKKSIWINPFWVVDFGFWFWKFCWFLLHFGCGRCGGNGSTV